MAAADAQRDGANLIGRFPMALDLADVKQFADATGLAPTDQDRQTEIPFTYPMAWLGKPEVKAAVRDAVRKLVGDDTKVPIHLKQTITRSVPLKPGATYTFRVWLSQPDALLNFTMIADAIDTDGQVVFELTGSFVFVAGFA